MLEKPKVLSIHLFSKILNPAYLYLNAFFSFFSRSVIVAFFKARCCFFLSRSFGLAASCFWSSFQTFALKRWDVSVAVNADMVLN